MKKKFDEMSRLEVVAELLKDGNQLAEIPHEKQEAWMLMAALGGDGDIYRYAAEDQMYEKICYAMGLFPPQYRYQFDSTLETKGVKPYPQVKKLSRLEPVRTASAEKHPRKYKRQLELNEWVEALIGGMAIDCMRSNLLSYSDLSVYVREMQCVAKAAVLLNPKNMELVPKDIESGQPEKLYLEMKTNGGRYKDYTIDQIKEELVETFKAEKDKPLIPTKPRTR